MTKDLGLPFRGAKGSDIKILVYVDTNHVVCIDSRRSVSGGAVMALATSSVGAGSGRPPGGDQLSLQPLYLQEY